MSEAAAAGAMSLAGRATDSARQFLGPGPPGPAEPGPAGQSLVVTQVTLGHGSHVQVSPSPARAGHEFRRPPAGRRRPGGSESTSTDSERCRCFNFKFKSLARVYGPSRVPPGRRRNRASIRFGLGKLRSP